MSETQRQLKEWAARKRAAIVLKKCEPGTMVKFGGGLYEVAHTKAFPHGVMVGIYDEPPSKHVDYINPRSLTVPCARDPE